MATSAATSTAVVPRKALAPIPQAHYSAAQYRQAIETFVASLHRYGMITVPVLGDNPCPRNGPNPPGSQYFPCSDNQQVMPDAANAPEVSTWTECYLDVPVASHALCALQPMALA